MHDVVELPTWFAWWLCFFAGMGLSQLGYFIYTLFKYRR
jgi:hypothetical protein